ncbi:MAG TPA: glycosyltransferase family 4 protein [Verrucomicrobiae bacterium]|jgi:glycosyltransferase involved in cell wall biosynthesis|nr:glycosyltransferase family 4 protein [Verrucomicrobiae bacterium]
MKILAITNLYPPLHAGTFDHHCQAVTESLRMRGHTVFILTSSHGLQTEQRDEEVHRRLMLNGVYGHPAVTGYLELKSLELHNNQAVLETIEQFAPDLVHVFSLHGISKSLLFTLHNTRLPVVYDVFDHWLSGDVREDPWLRFWNAPSLPLLTSSSRKALEMSGERGRLDATAPTRLMKGYDRVPALFGGAKELASVEPNSIGGFRFDRIYFCSEALKNLAERVGFLVRHAGVIYPGISPACFGEIKPANAPITKLLLVARLNEESGAMTALKALKIARKAGLKVTLSTYGRGDSGYMAELRSFAVTNQLPVEFLNVSNSTSDLPAVYKRHDVLLHTPEWAEPFPFTALEAMGCGLPVISASSGGACELLRHGENCMTYPPGDPAQLAARVQELLISPALRCQMAETAQSEVLAQFNDAAVMDRVESFLNESHSQTE